MVLSSMSLSAENNKNYLLQKNKGDLQDLLAALKKTYIYTYMYIN